MDDESYETVTENKTSNNKSPSSEIEIDISSTLESIYGPIKVKNTLKLKRTLD